MTAGESKRADVALALTLKAIEHINIGNLEATKLDPAKMGTYVATIYNTINSGIKDEVPG